MTECHTIHSCHKDNINRAYCKIKNTFNLTLPHTYLPVTHIFTLRGMYTNDVPLSSSLNSARTPRRRRNSFPVGNTRIFRVSRNCLTFKDIYHFMSKSVISCHAEEAFRACRTGFPVARKSMFGDMEEPLWGCGEACSAMMKKTFGGQKSLFRTTKGDEPPHKSI